MKTSQWYAVALVTVGFALGVGFAIQAGCSGSKDDPVDPKPKAEEQSVTVKEVDLGALNIDTVPPTYPVDDGRLQITRPKDWSVQGRSQGKLIEFSASKNSRVPRIVIQGVDNQDIQQLDEHNVLDFYQQIVERLGDTELIEQPVALKLGETYCIRYVLQCTLSFTKKNKKTTMKVERQVLITVQNGREYTLHADSFPGKFKDVRNPAYAVLGNMRFVQPQVAKE